MTTQADLDIVIVNWNSGELLQQCVQSVGQAAAASPLAVKLLIVDNASQDNSAAGLREAGCPIEVQINSRNVGFGAACNQGAALGNADYLLFLNPDTEVSAASLLAPVNFLRQPGNERYGVCGIQLRDEQGAVARSCARLPRLFHLFCTSIGVAQLFPRWPLGIPLTDWDHGSSRDVDHVIGAFYLIRRDLFAAVGGFDQRYFVYLEDLDLSAAVRKAGFQSYYLATTHARHTGGGTSRQIKARRLFYSIDSRLTYIKKHFGRVAFGCFVPLIFGPELGLRLLTALLRFDGHSPGEILAAYQLLWRRRRGRVRLDGTPAEVRS